jgi:hypothetical protein
MKDDPRYQERPFAYELYYQLRKLQEAGRMELQDVVVQSEVSKGYQGIGLIPDLILHIPGRTDANMAAFEFKLSGNLRNHQDLFKLVRLKRELGYREAFMIIVGSLAETRDWLRAADALTTSDGEEICIIVYDPTSSERVVLTKSVRIRR